mgnify:FL=1
MNDYEKNGFVLGIIPRELTEGFMRHLDVAENCPADIFHVNEGFSRWGRVAPFAATDLARMTTPEAALEFSKYVTAYDFDTPEGRSILTKILNYLKPHVQEALNSPWKCDNVRIWKTAPNDHSFGLQNSHRDGFPRDPRYITKIMLYLSAPSLQGGTTQLTESNFTVTGEKGTWFLFDNNLLHRGISPTTDFRVVCELTVEKITLEAELEPVFAGFGATW